MKDNLAFIHEKTEELEMLRDEIQEKMKEHDSLSMELDSEEAKVGRCEMNLVT